MVASSHAEKKGTNEEIYRTHVEGSFRGLGENFGRGGLLPVNINK